MRSARRRRLQLPNSNADGEDRDGVAAAGMAPAAEDVARRRPPADRHTSCLHPTSLVPSCVSIRHASLRTSMSCRIHLPFSPSPLVLCGPVALSLSLRSSGPLILRSSVNPLRSPGSFWALWHSPKSALKSALKSAPQVRPGPTQVRPRGPATRFRPPADRSHRGPNGPCRRSGATQDVPRGRAAAIGLQRRE